MACSGRFLGLRTSGISGKFDSRGASDGDCEYLVGFFVRRRGLCESTMQIMEKERDDYHTAPASKSCRRKADPPAPFLKCALLTVSSVPHPTMKDTEATLSHLPATF